MVTLGIETSCDETAAAVTKDSHILSNIVSSSIPLHRKYGGVIPEIASRFHVEYLSRVTKKALRKAGYSLKDLDLIAVTEKPGLPGSLLTGQAFSRALSYSLGIPLVAVDHLISHLYASFLNEARRPDPKEPFVGAVVSGGHTNIFIYRGSFKDIAIVGRTMDDAIGEAFDKVAKIMGIGYPGGPRIERRARSVKSSPINFPRAYLDKDSFDFSLSGIKTAVLYYVKNRKLSDREISRVSWSFQEAVFDVLIERIVRACKKFKMKDVVLGGGVIANMRLRSRLEDVCRGLGYKLFYPLPALCVDNAAMVAGLGQALWKNKYGGVGWR